MRLGRLARDVTSTGPSLAAAVSLSTGSKDLSRLLRRAQAVAARRPSAEALLAVGALEHAMAKSTGDPAYLTSAFEHTQEGLAQDPSSLTGLFNRGLIAADLGLCRYAARTWRQYRERDPASDWSEEAKARLSLLPCLRLEGPESRDAPDGLFKNAVETLLPRWIEARQKGSPEVAALLSGIVRAGDELRSRAGDPMVRELARELARAGDPGSLSGISFHVQGWKLFEEEKYSDTPGAPGVPGTPGARTLLATAEPALRRCCPWLAAWNDVWLAGSDINIGRFAPAEARLSRLARSPEVARSPHLAGRAFWAWGLAALRAGRFGTADDRILRADQELGRSGYSSSFASVLILRADNLSLLGFEREAWKPRILAMRALQEARGTFSFFHNGLFDGANVAQRSGTPHLADAFLEEAALLAHQQGNTKSEIETLLSKAKALRRRGAWTEASTTLRQALAKIRSLPPGDVRYRFEKTAVLAENPTPAGRAGKAELEAAVLFFGQNGPPALQLQALRALATLERHNGALAAARGAVEEAVRVLHRLQSDITTEDAGIRQLDSVQDLFDEAIDTAVAEKQPLRALALLEAARRNGDFEAVSREIADLHLAPQAGISPPPDDEPALVLLGLTPSTFVWWRLEGKDVVWGSREAAPVLSAVQAVVRNAPNGRVKTGDLERLYDLLLRDALRGVAPRRLLVLVPDRLLQRVPLSALRNPATKVRLIEQRAISLSTSLRAARERRKADRHIRRRSDWRVTAVGDPAFDLERISLRRLPGAAAEAREIARLYGKRGALAGQDAGAEAVRESVASSEVLHLAAHTKMGADAFRQTFVLAASRDGVSSGLATPDEILPARAPLQLAVLSGCSTLGQQPSRSGGLLGLARAFVAHGVPATIGTLWPVGDRQIPGLMIDFHRFLLRGDSAAEALRQAQLAYLKQHPDACCDWAALQLVGDLPAEPTRNP